MEFWTCKYFLPCLFIYLLFIVEAKSARLLSNTQKKFPMLFPLIHLDLELITMPICLGNARTIIDCYLLMVNRGISDEAHGMFYFIAETKGLVEHCII